MYCCLPIEPKLIEMNEISLIPRGLKIYYTPIISYHSKSSLPLFISLIPSPYTYTVLTDPSPRAQTLALTQYQEAFISAAVDGAFLYDLSDDDLKSSLGVEHRLHRKKIINSILRLKEAERTRSAALSTVRGARSMPLTLLFTVTY